MPSFKTITLGCKVNQYETQYVREGLVRLGYAEAASDAPADLYLVNTCTVTGEADLKSRKAIRQFHRENPQAEIVVMGCYVTRDGQAVASLPGVSEIITDKRQLPALLQRFGLVEAPRGISSFGSRHRAYVKVQDGCRLNCTYCIIPRVRPTLASRPVEDVLDEIRRLVGSGYREIVLTGIHLGHYGVDFGRQSPGGRMRLPQLLERIVQLDGHFRLRLSSIEGVETTPELLAVMADHPTRICPHLHISMQSGSDAVLRRMRRRWQSSRFRERCQMSREILDNPALTTDIIVGFPGETDADFAATCRMAEEIGFSKIHIFRFSPRAGTPAAEMPDQIPPDVKQQRAAELAALERQLRFRYFHGLLGRELQVLIEEPHRRQPEVMLGTSARYAPVELPASRGMPGQLVEVRAEAAAEDRILAA